jgi:zinc protease
MRTGLLAALLLLLALVCAPTLVSAQTSAKSDAGQGARVELPPGIERVVSVEGITEYRLPNGLRVLLFPDQSKEVVAVNITYMVGSRHENYGETGMAHLLEHMLFKGTPRHSNIWKEFRDRGASANATTHYDRTNYYAALAASDENLEWVLELEADRMVNSFVAKKDLDAEMTVVRNEMEGKENNPGAVLSERLMATAFEWHGYGKAVLGARSDVENVPIERLQAFYKTYYRPDNAVLIVAGKVSEAKALELVHKHFASIPRPDRPLPPIYTVEPAQDGERLVTVRRVGDYQLAMAGYHVPPASHPDFAAVQIAVNILGHTPSGRLHKRLVEGKKAKSIGGSTLSLKDSGYLFFNALLNKEDSLADAREALEKTLQGLVAEPPTADEVERARIRFANSFEANLRDPRRVSDLLSEWSARGDWRLLLLHRDRIAKVGVEDVKRIAATYLKATNRTSGLYVPTDKADRVPIPNVSQADVAAMVKDYKGAATVATGEAFDPSPANIEARTVRSKIGNLQVALLPKKTRGNSVVLRLSLQMGDEKSLMNRGLAGNLAAAMLMRGTQKHTREQIRNELDKLKAYGSVSGDATSVAASFETTRENLPRLLRLVTEIMREPAFPASEFEQLVQQSLTNVEASRREPSMVAINALRRHVDIHPRGDVRYVGTFEEQVAAYKAATLDDVRAFHRDFYGAANGQLTVVGDFDAAEVAALAKELLGDWKSRTPYRRIAAEYRDFTVINKSFEIPDKANAVFIAYQRLKVRDDDPDYPALLMAGNALAGNGYKNRLLDRLRQKDGLSYSAGGSITAGAIDPVGSFVAIASYAPQNAVRLEAAFKEEIARALKDGFAQDELDGARKGWLQQRSLGRSQDGSLATRIHGLTYLGRTLAWDVALDERIKALSVADLNRALRRFVDLNRMIILKAGDFASAKRPPAGAAKE